MSIHCFCIILLLIASSRPSTEHQAHKHTYAPTHTLLQHLSDVAEQAICRISCAHMHTHTQMHTHTHTHTHTHARMHTHHVLPSIACPGQGAPAATSSSASAAIPCGSSRHHSCSCSCCSWLPAQKRRGQQVQQLL